MHKNEDFSGFWAVRIQSIKILFRIHIYPSSRAIRILRIPILLHERKQLLWVRRKSLRNAFQSGELWSSVNVASGWFQWVHAENFPEFIAWEKCVYVIYSHQATADMWPDWRSTHACQHQGYHWQSTFTVLFFYHTTGTEIIFLSRADLAVDYWAAARSKVW